MKTLRTYDHLLKKFQGHFGDIDLSSITCEQILTFLSELSAWSLSGMPCLTRGPDRHQRLLGPGEDAGRHAAEKTAPGRSLMFPVWSFSKSHSAVDAYSGYPSKIQTVIIFDSDNNTST